MNSFNKIKLTDLAKRQTNALTKTEKLDLVLYDLDYLGNLDIESKYLQSNTIPWLIAQVKLLELNKRINSISIEINVRKNTIICYKNEFKPRTFGLPSRDTSKRTEFISHKLTNIFKLTQHPNEKNCFAYFYRQENSFTYTLHVFSSNKSNIVQALHEFQMNALRLHEHNKIHYEKMFDFKIVSKIQLAKEQLNSPNFMDTYIDKSKNDMLNLNLIIKFKSNKLCLEIINEKSIEKEYHQIAYLNTSITNKHYFCLAYYDSLDNDVSHLINGLILYSKDVNYIDDVIREYALKISTELNNSTSQLASPPSSSLQLTKRVSVSKLEQHTCFLCPMQQYVELCEYLNQFQTNEEKVYQILNEKISHNLDKLDQNYLLDCLNEQNLNLNTYEDLIHTNQLLVGLIHRLCKSKQNQHLISNFNLSSSSSLSTQEFTFFLMKNFKPSKSANLNLENNENNCPNIQSTQTANATNGVKLEIKKRIKPQRSNTIETSHNINLFDSKLKHNNSKLISNEFFLAKNLLNQTKPSLKQHLNHTNTSNASIRRYIFNKIVGAPNTFFNNNNTVSKVEEESQLIETNESKQRFKFKYDAIQLWKKVISEQILLIKMEKENKRLRLKALAQLKESQLNRFSYVEITPCLKEIDKVWETKLEIEQRVDLNEIRQLLSKGIPQTRRGHVWFWLVKQYRMHNKVESSFLDLNVSYDELLKQYSIHQHSILLDLGRTFPNHPNFKYQFADNESKTVRFGLGQLALFNVLKAYSIFDNEVGYCQGLSFVVGFLLIQLNNDEEKAFELLKFLMVDLNLRGQYLPNMKDLQKHMYQLSRLINENCNDVYLHLENYEISTSLYAASWFLSNKHAKLKF